ncbi:oncostatin-M isoform X2 [Calypte anna]|uniref:oncostatin-M isoform X2 n=1 Tax=Calypte anna TaxID=9244 RepID=UPI0011C35564|nr:oncostatin-M isoform X2 [Calypte anna]
MRRDGWLPGVLGAVTKGLLILWAVPGQGGRPLQPPTLQQVQALEKDQGLAIGHLCRTNRPPEWLRGPSLGTRGLRGLRGTMTHMAQALQDITRHQRDLNPPGAEILRRLASAHLKVRGLLNNLEGLYPAPSPQPTRRLPPSPTAPTKVFRQKLEGCRILWSYSRFLVKLNALLETRRIRAHRERQRAHQGSRMPTGS